MRPFKIEHIIEVPDNVEVKFENKQIIVKGPRGEVRREVRHPKIYVEIEGNKVRIYSYFVTKRELKILNSLKAHLNNMIRGVTEGFRYRLKAVYVHFPIKIKVQGNQFIVENFLGERTPRVMRIPEGVTVKVQGEEVIVESHDLELAGNTAGLIEQLTRVKGKDRRKFQDGIYIIEKPTSKY